MCRIVDTTGMSAGFGIRSMSEFLISHHLPLIRETENTITEVHGLTEEVGLVMVA